MAIAIGVLDVTTKLAEKLGIARHWQSRGDSNVDACKRTSNFYPQKKKDAVAFGPFRFSGFQLGYDFLWWCKAEVGLSLDLQSFACKTGILIILALSQTSSTTHWSSSHIFWQVSVTHGDRLKIEHLVILLSVYKNLRNMYRCIVWAISENFEWKKWKGGKKFEGGRTIRAGLAQGQAPRSSLSYRSFLAGGQIRDHHDGIT